MGMFWPVMRYRRVPAHALVLQEVHGTISRRWPLLWRLGQYRYLLRVVGMASPRRGYYLYFYVEGRRIVRYHQLIHTEFVSVRVGPQKTYFWAETRTHEPLQLTYSGTKKGGPLVTKKRNEAQLKFFPKGFTFTKI
ncbi:MAG: hypothetical protein RL538_27 [Candidatus Parcubacteria bacterium]|jgi:hypothetical protein